MPSIRQVQIWGQSEHPSKESLLARGAATKNRMREHTNNSGKKETIKRGRDISKVADPAPREFLVDSMRRGGAAGANGSSVTDPPWWMRGVGFSASDADAAPPPVQLDDKKGTKPTPPPPRPGDPIARQIRGPEDQHDVRKRSRWFPTWEFSKVQSPSGSSISHLVLFENFVLLLTWLAMQVLEG